MADIRLAKPAAGTTQTVPSAPNGRFIFDFPADAATLTRNGDDLVLSFEDGSSIRLQGFYTTYSKEEMPSFQVEGVEISGEDFFAALGEDLMPAAGPAAGSSAARGGRYNEYGGSDLLDGIDHLGRLDVGFDGGVQLATDTVEPSPWYEGDGWVDHGVTVTPLDSDAAAEVVTVHEAGLANGTTPGAADAPVSAGGSLIINAPDGVASIVIGNVTVFENGALTGNTVSTDEGTLTVTGYDPATGRLDFNYTLDRNTTEHDKSDPATDTQISHDLTVTVTDTDGDSASTTITVNVVDDGPSIEATDRLSMSVDESDLSSGAGVQTVANVDELFKVEAGADGEGSRTYELTLDVSASNELTAIVDGEQVSVKMSIDAEGRIVGKAGDVEIFNVHVDSKGNVTFTMSGEGTLAHPDGRDHDDGLSLNGIGVKVTVTDKDGDSSSAEAGLDLTIRDDGPTISASNVKVTEGTSVEGTISYSYGADEPSGSTVTVKGGTLVDGTSNQWRVDHGVVTLNGDGTFTFTADANIAETVTSQEIIFQITDADGDVAEDTVTVTLEQAQAPEYTADVTVDEAALEGGNAYEDMGSKTADISLDGYTILSGGDGKYGSIEQAADGTWKYTLEHTYTDTTTGQDGRNKVTDADSVEITVRDDATGNEFTITVNVDIIDDVPEKPNKIDFVAENDDMFFYDNDPTIIFQIDGGNDPDKLENLKFGADVTAAGEEGTPAQIIVHVNDTEFTIDVTRGENGQLQFLYDEDGKIRFASGNAEPSEALTYDPDTGHFTYTRPEGDVGGSADNYTFKLTLKDSDGDTVTVESLPIRTTPQTTIPTVTGSAITVKESALKHGSHPNDDGWKGEGSFIVNLNGEDGSITLTGDDEQSVTLEITDEKYVPDADSTITVNGVQVTVTGAEQNDDGWTVKYSYELTEDQAHNNSNVTGAGDTLKGTIGITVTDASSDTATGSITVNVQDDGPVFSEESGNVNITDKSDEFWSYKEEISFTGNDVAGDFDGKNQVTMWCEDNTLTLYVGKIQFDANGNIDTSNNWNEFIDNQATFHINGEDKEHGIGVHSNYTGGIDFSNSYMWDNRKNEIGYDPISRQSEAVIIELDKPAVNMNIDLSLFFSAVGSDTNPEKAIFLFYKDGEYVGKSHLSSDEASGDVQQNGFSALPAGGFDTVVIAAGDNGTYPDEWDNSEFNISAITFNTFEGVDRTLTGQLDATSADGIKGYSVDTDKLATLGLKSDGMPISYGWNEDTGMLLAKAGDATVFELVLNTETGAWTMVQYKEYEGELKLPFTATDGDDDSTSISVAIPATGAESGTYKVTDSDAEKAVLAAAEQEMKSAVRSGEALATAAVLAGMATVLPDEVPAVEGDRPDTPDETLVAAPAEAADAPAALSFFEEGAALPDSPVEGMDDTPLLFANLALAGQEELMVSAAQTDAADGPLWADASGTDDTSGTVVGETATAGPDAAHAGTAAPEAVLHGTDGDDILLGGDGDELIFGGSGDDFIDGGAGRDTIYAGAGNDIIVYDQQDYLVSGGSGIDFMVSDDTSLTLDGLLSNTSSDKPLVSGIEVLLKGEDALSLTSINDLADRYGITLRVNEAGEETLQLDDRWTKQDDGSYDFNGGAEADGGLTLETSLTPVETGDPASEAVQQQVFTLEHSNG